MNGKISLPVINAKGGSDIDMEAELAKFEEEERKRLGIDDKVEHWTDKMVGLDFKKSERPNITLLIGGLTMIQDTLIEAGLKGPARAPPRPPPYYRSPVIRRLTGTDLAVA